MKATFINTVIAIISKDLRAELRSRELIATMLLFSLLSVLSFSFALQLDRVAQESAVAGVLWVTIVFASLLGLNRSMAMERENGSMDAMLLAPVDRTAIFVGKLIGNLIFTLTVGIALLPLMSLLFNLSLLRGWLVLVMLLGTFGICISGTLISTMTIQTRAREALLPIAMLPVVLPILLAVVNATNGILADAPINENNWFLWLQVISVVDIVYLVLSLLTFAYVVEE